MARREILIYKDDIDGTEQGVAPRKFGFDGATYEIDLSEGNYAKLREALAPFIAAGNKVKTGRWGATSTAKHTQRKAASATEQKEFNAKVREWVTDNGIKVKPRGRVPEWMIDAYMDGKNTERLEKEATRRGAELATVVQGPAMTVPSATFSAPETPVRDVSAEKALAEAAGVVNGSAKKAAAKKATPAKKAQPKKAASK